MNECEYCEGKMITRNTVQNKTDEETYRLKKCEKCGHKIYTVEFEVENNQQFRNIWNKWIRIRTNNCRNRRKNNDGNQN